MPSKRHTLEQVNQKPVISKPCYIISAIP